MLSTKDADTEREYGRERKLSGVEKVEVDYPGRKRGVKRKESKEWGREELTRGGKWESGV